MTASWKTPGRLGVAGSGGEYGWKLEGWDVRGTKKHFLGGFYYIYLYVIMYQNIIICIYIYIYIIYIYRVYSKSFTKEPQIGVLLVFFEVFGSLFYFPKGPSFSWTPGH